MVAESVTARLVQRPRRPGRQFWHEEPAFLHEQLPHRPALLHLQQFLTTASLFIQITQRSVNGSNRPDRTSWHRRNVLPGKRN